MARETAADRLGQAYARLLARRARDSQPPDIGVEVIQSLADGSYAGDDRAVKLDAVLADARTAAELHFFLDLAREQPRPSRMPAWLKAAASVVLLFTAAVVWRTLRPAPDTLRSSGEDFLTLPAAAAVVAADARFAWHSMQYAEEYRFELIDEQGNLIHQAIMRDTSLVLPADVRLGDAATYRWWVTARLRDGTETTASPRAIQFRR